MGPVICLVTDRRTCGHRWEDTLVRRVGAAARAGVHLIQVRERGLDTRHLLRLVSRCVREVADTPARLLVNDRLDVALAAGAHGIHLPASASPAARVREVVAHDFVIGRSVHSVDEAEDAARAGGVDYLMFGTVFPTVSKPSAVPAGLQGLAVVCAAVPLPVLAVGGVTLDRLSPIARSGASGFAAIGLFQTVSVEESRRTVRQAGAAFDTLRHAQE